MWAVAVLGPVELRRDGRSLPLPSGKTTELLVRLALDAGRLVRTDRLIEDLWADDAASTGKNTLQSKVSQLRRALGESGLLTSTRGGYSLALDPQDVDAIRVVHLAAQASAARQSDDAASCLQITTEALELFRGEVLAEAGEGDWLHPHRVRLEEVRLALVEDQLAARVELQVGGDVVADLEGLVASYPLRENLWCSLITALYRAGRQADALAAYVRVRDVLSEELGLEPGPELQALEAQILQHHQALQRPVGSQSEARLAVGNVPALSSNLLGRSAELEQLLRLLAERPLVTVVGPAGMGKTRVAIEAARLVNNAGGSWLVRLDAVDAASGSASLAQTVAETLNVAGGEATLIERLAVPTLLVLDNCEHVVEAVSDLAARLLDTAPQLRVLATSQLPLGLDGESVFGLEPLSMAASVELFASRAAGIRKQFVLDAETAATVEEVCQSLDGLPLAIELAAARVKSLSVRDIARRLDDRFALLQDPTSRRPERRRALSAAIAWSYELLFPDDQRGLWALACFVGGAPLAAAERVLGCLDVPAASAADVVGRLVDRSLASVEVGPDGGVRYRLLDSIRVYARARLADSGAAHDAFAAHAAWFAEAGAFCAATVRGIEQPQCLSFARSERANIDAALGWCAENDPALGVRIANGFGWTWVVLGDGVAGAARVRKALRAAVDTPIPDRVEALLLAGWLEASAGDLACAEDDLVEALELSIGLDDELLRADAQRHLTFLRVQQGRAQDALDLAHASLEIDRRRQRHWEAAASLVLAAFGWMVLGEIARGVASAQEALQLLEPIDDAWGVVHAEAMLGAIAQADRRFDEAAGRLARAAAASERLGFLGQAAFHLTKLGRIQQQAGDEKAALATLQQAMDAAVSCGDLRMAATARLNMARVLRVAGETAEAVALLQQNDLWYSQSGGGDGAVLTKALIAAMAAPERLEGILDEAARAQETEAQTLTLDALARAAAERGDLEAAAQNLGTADALAAAIPHLIEAADRVDARAIRDRVSQESRKA